LCTSSTCLFLGKFYRIFEGVASGPMLSGVIVGSVYPEQWGIPQRTVDFFDLKGDIEALLALTGHTADFIFEPKQQHGLHAHQASCIKKNGREIGWMGQLNPVIADKLGVTEPIYVFELVFKEINQIRKSIFKSLSKSPSVRRDISILVDKTLSAAEIKQAIAAPQLEQILFFDVYEGKGVPPGQKSMALGLIFQDPIRTLTDEDVNIQMAQIIALLQKNLRATLRS
ncbi:MAG: phenylalanine--tRNA ligase subunit beta, partial [Gammaproteobacteria bacterium]